MTLSTEKIAQRGASSLDRETLGAQVKEQPTATADHTGVLVHDAPHFCTLLATPHPPRGRVTYHDNLPPTPM